MRGASPEARRGLVRAAGALSVLAGLIHVLAAPEHLAEWWGYGLFFLLASVAQLYFGIALLAVLAPGGLAGDDRVPRGGNEGFFLLGFSRRAWFLLGVLGNLAVVALYAVTRTLGVPLLGPEAGEVEPVTALGVASKLMELALVAALLLLLRLGPQAAPRA